MLRYIGVLNLLNSSVLANEKKVLKAGTYIPIVFDESISSKTAKPNQTVHIKVASDVTVGNVKFFNQNDKGIIYIKKVVPARKFSKAGRLEFGGKEYNGKKITSGLIAPFNINVSGDTLSDGYIVDFNGNQHII